MNSEERIRYFDIAKGLSMIAIVAGHMGNSPINQFVFTFHVPIFFLISGYFMKPMDDIPFIKRKSKTIVSSLWHHMWICHFRRCTIYYYYNPRIFTGSFNRKILVFGCSIRSGTIEYNGSFHIGIIGALWFLPALFFH